MPRKRKSEAEATPIEPIGEPMGNHKTDLRRSNRIRTNPSIRSNRKDDQGHESDGDVNSGEELQIESFKQEAIASSPGVKQAIDHLAEMERGFRQATKRQKLQLAESSVPTHRDSPPQKGSDPRPTTTLDPEGREHSPTTIGAFPTAEDIIQSSKEGGEANIERHISPGSASDASVERGAARTPPVDSGYLPLPWKGRLGYACTNTYLRTATPPVFTSRTCQASSIIEHRHPLQEPSEPEHQTANRPDKNKPPDNKLGQQFLEGLGLANCRDIIKMILWNNKYNIKFMQLSSDMFPFASHAEHGYKLAHFASDVLREAGAVITELDHRVITHLGQSAQLGSQDEEIVAATIRDIAYHDEMLSLLRLPPQQDRNAVVVIHVGGSHSDKDTALARFRHNYTTQLTPRMRSRVVLENDDLSWSIHDLLPICEELSIPLVINYANHNIVFDRLHTHEGTFDLAKPDLVARVAATWLAKGIDQIMAYGESRPGDVDVQDRRSRSARVKTLPPCSNDMDLLIEAEDREQAVFELMRNFKLPGFEILNDLVPHEREDENKPAQNTLKSLARKDQESPSRDEEEQKGGIISSEELGMGGPMNRVFWPLGMEHWLHPRGKDLQ